MQWFYTNASCVALAALVAAPAHGQEKKAVGKGIDPATVAAYEKLGAIYGGWEKNGVGSWTYSWAKNKARLR